MKNSLCSKLYECYLRKRYKLFTKKSIEGVQVQFYWRLKRTQVLEGKVRANVRLHRVDIEDQKLLLRDAIREALAIRIKKKHH